MGFERKSAYCLLTCLLAHGCAGLGELPVRERVASQQRAHAAGEGERDALSVIVHLRQVGDGAPDRAAREAVLARGLPGLTITYRYRHVPAVAGRVDRAALAALEADPAVAGVTVDGVGQGQLREAVPAIGADQVRSLYGLTGRGVRVALLDTGIDTTHPDLRDAVVAQHCFTQAGCPPNAAPEGPSAEDDHGHGTNAAGIIASEGLVSSRGFAPDAELVVVKINDRNNAGYESDWVAGLDWIYDNLATLNVRVVNLSIATNAIYAADGECDARHPALARALRNLHEAGVTVFAASGNGGSPSRLGAPACNTGPIAVGATYDGSTGRQPPLAPTYHDRWGGSFARCGDEESALDKIACFTNSNARLDLVAPGAPILSDALRGRSETYWGTSQASPVAAGVAALMLQCNPDLTPSDIREVMQRTGVPVVDPKNGRTFPSLRALAAVRAACPHLEEEGAPEATVGASGGVASLPGRGAARALGSGGEPGLGVGSGRHEQARDRLAGADPHDGCALVRRGPGGWAALLLLAALSRRRASPPLTRVGPPRSRRSRA